MELNTIIINNNWTLTLHDLLTKSCEIVCINQNGVSGVLGLYAHVTRGFSPEAVSV